VIEGMADTRDLGKLFDARIPIIAIESPDEPRVLGLLLNLAIARGLAFSQWTVTGGLRRGGIEGPSTTPELREPEALLQHIAATNGPGLYALCDFHPWLDEPTNLRFLKDIALDFDRLGNCIVLVSHRLTIPPEIGRLCASFELRLPSDEELMAMIRREAQEWARLHKGAKVSTDQATLKRLLSNVRGVSHSDARILLRHAIFDDGAITASDLPEMNRLKFELLDSEGVLHFEYDTATFTDVAGLGNLKSWLELRRSAFLDQGTADRPRGVLLCPTPPPGSLRNGSTPSCSMRPAPPPARSAATRTFPISSPTRTSPNSPASKRGFSITPSACSSPAAHSSTPPARWSPRKARPR
jgi:hypothetical protein